ncbi:outer dense fiber protein 3-like [Stegodyphus dumicola]|uniref:outer dense fiber protein 3-like n=1 Tax=Stegodyphus dumicola TaxID=202533 RepID=UPI0015A92F3B|nr:outer dense fiber protein 3-like [Stegodyphus dumicola]
MTKDHKEGLVKPGNEEYLSYYNRQGEWKTTKAIGTIGSMNIGPGPAIVNLPQTIGDHGHDPRRAKAPAYGIGGRDMRQFFTCSPGPAVYDTRKITNKGKDECHAPFVGEKIDGLTFFTTPGPAVYHRGYSDPMVYPRSPSYTMRKKTAITKKIFAPAPNLYTLPETLGPGRAPFAGGPAYSVSNKSDKTGIPQQNPGPAAYQLPPTNVNKCRSPAYSMGIKKETDRIGITSPGPASNEYHVVKFHKPSTPRYTFGIRHSPYKAFQKFAAEN